MSNTPSLLPCPFCGSKAVASVNRDESLWSHDVVDWTRVHCTNDDCNAQTEATCEGYEPSAIEVWNRRTPPAVAGEPVAWMGRHDKTDLYYRKPPQADVVPLYTTPQPTQAQAGAVPLTDDEALDAFCHTPGIHQFVQAFMAGVRFAEQHHGITGGQHES